MRGFLLSNDTSYALYQKVKDLPIIDYHCHLSAEEIYTDKPYQTLTEIWLLGDHYKWRQMRTYGIDEKYITGNAGGYEKFYAFISMLEFAAGNPLYSWSKMELKKYFDIDMDLNKKNAPLIWEKANKCIQDNTFSPISAINMSNVKAVGTTEEIFCDLKYHNLLKEDKRLNTLVLPSFRGDRAINIFDKNFIKNINLLSEVSGVVIKDLASLENALIKQLDNFKSAGCVACDFAVEGIEYIYADKEIVNQILIDALKGVVDERQNIYMSYIFKFMLTESYKRDYAVQIHIGAMRNNNTRMFDNLGADTGYDTISSKPYLTGLRNLLDAINNEGNLGKTIIFNLNPAYNAEIATLIGCFQGDGIKGKMQFGAAWWFNDTKLGIKKHLECLSELSHLGVFIGMLTDSRSFISYPRHDFFRRILCDYVGVMSENGEYTKDMDTLTNLVSGISYYNAKEYFNII